MMQQSFAWDGLTVSADGVIQSCLSRSGIVATGFLADRTLYGRANARALRPSSVDCRLSVTLCIVDKRCVLE